MKRLGLFLIFLAVAGIGFGSGYWYRDRDMALEAEMEDYTLSNVLAILGYHHYALRGDITGLRELLDVNMNDHLYRVRRYSGVIHNDAFLAAKIRTLNAAGILWDEHPPFKSKQWEDYTFKDDLQKTTSENMRLLGWAKEQCAAKPELECKSPNSAVKRDAPKAARPLP